MFVVVGRFRFRPMSSDERRAMFAQWEQEFTPLVRERHGFKSVQFVQLGDDEVMTSWLWDSEADWDAAQPAFGPFLQQHVAPHLAGPPERMTGNVVLHVTP